MSRSANSYDFVVLGGGSAGYAAARTARDLGLKTAVVEGGEHVGGLCILRGCMPTKALLETAHRFHEIRNASEFGLRVGSAKVDWKKVVSRKDRLIEDFASYRRGQLKSGEFDFFRAYGAFADAHTLNLTPVGASEEKVPRSIKSKTFLIATGSRITPPPVPGLEAVKYLTSDDAIHLTKPPKSLIVLGGGPIAIEFADYFQKMGVQVTLLQRSLHILKNHDEDVASEVEQAFRDSGMKVITGTRLIRAAVVGKNKVVYYEQQGKSKQVRAKEILYALGREPNTLGLNLQAAGVKLRQKTIRINRQMQTNQPHIFAAGDVSGPYEIVHVAIQQGEVAANNAAVHLGESKIKPKTMDYRVPMEVVFSQPEVASVGLNEKAAKSSGKDVISASYPFNDHGKSMIMGAKFGFVKCIADRKSGRIVGAQIVGPNASDLIHEFAVAITLRITVEKFLQVPHYHPTLAEIVTYPVEEIAEKLGRI
ncbi:MAG: dihydrolipoyl dehydrogenase [Verrucomicrobiota bacterium]